MAIDRIETGTRMSRVVIHNQTAYLCGQVAKDESADIAGQTTTTLEKVEALLADIGSSKEKILSVTIYVADMADFAAMNSVWDAWVAPGHAPARACVEAKMARPELKVEMSVIAAV
ncbi:RidA family protein [Motiliproteus coralliicola]|uniref:RidA family protein n=1 Tax=Motiliproteus coralliicola TaxID=2283196 RepID=A0A369WAB8_9GAMM|nr:RidA family protein [Motiliproteus coralliicola]RDE18950.1 RidA family protein [Motiliproteus coralliicola]